MLPGKDVLITWGAEAPAEAKPSTRKSNGYRRALLPFTGIGMEYPTHLMRISPFRKPFRALDRNGFARGPARPHCFLRIFLSRKSQSWALLHWRMLGVLHILGFSGIEPSLGAPRI